MYLLRRHFGIGAHDALNVLPAWEIDLLLGGLDDEQRQEAEQMNEDTDD